MCTIQNISSILNKLDTSVITYNGSLIPITDTNLHLCAYRATTKPYGNEGAPSFPYINLNYNMWFNKGNYIGLAILSIKKNNIQVKDSCRYIHNINPHMSNYKYVQYLQKINKNDNPSITFNNLLSGPEDPRLYYKNNQIYMNYNSVLINPDAGCPGECVGMFEIHIDMSTLRSCSNKKFYPDKEKQLICSKVNGKPLFKGKKSSKELTLKNWSYAPGYFIDSYKDKAFLYDIISTDNCKRKPYIHTLQPLIQDNWSIALTTPTVEYNGFLYGVAHIRIPWEDIALLSDDDSNIIPTKFKKIIYKGDVHNKDFYLMSIYKIYNDEWSLTKPLLITGNVDEKYYSFNVNFPCGFFITPSGSFNVTFGLGDCLLFSYTDQLASLKFKIKQFNYIDLRVIEVNDLMLEKEYINNTLCNIPPLLNYLLPKTIRLFDLGGGGLRTLLYDSIHDTYSSIKRLGQSKILNLPSEIIRINLDIKKEILSGVGFGFSLASLEKLWDINIQKEAINLMKNKNYNSTSEIFKLYTHKIIQVNDSISHLYGVMSEYELNNKLKSNTLNFVNISIGTGINIAFSEKGTIKNYKTEIGTHFWDIGIGKIKRGIRKVFNNLTKNKMLNLLRVFFNLIPNNINMTHTWPKNWPLPDIVTLSGGGSIKYREITQDLSPTIKFIVFSDELIPYKGLIYSFKKSICNHTI